MRVAALAFVGAAAVGAVLALTAPVLTEVIPTSRPLDGAVVLVECLLGAVFVTRHADAWRRHRLLTVGLAGIATGALVRAVVARIAVPLALGGARTMDIAWLVVGVSWLAGLATAAGLALVASGIAVRAPRPRWTPLVAIVLVAGAMGIVQGITSLARVVAMQPGGFAIQTSLGSGAIVLIEIAAWTWLGVTAARRAALGGLQATAASLVVVAGIVAVSAVWLIPAVGIVVPAVPPLTLVLQSAVALTSATLLLVAFVRGLPEHREPVAADPAA